MGEFARSLVRDSQMRWLGPEKGITHMAAGAVINAAWDLIAKFYKNHSGNIFQIYLQRKS